MSDDPVATQPGDAPTSVLDEAPRLVRVLFALGGVCILMAAYVRISWALLVALPMSPRISLVLGQIGGLLAPALVLVLLAEKLDLAPALPGPHVAILRRHASALVLLALSTFLVAMAVGTVWMTALRATGWAWVKIAERMVLGSYGPILEVRRPLDVLVILVMLTVVPAACEEWAFRGFLQRVLRGAIGPRSAIWGSAILFAAFHVDPLGLPSRVVVGLSLGLAYERLGCLWPGMAIHAGYNLMVLCITPWDTKDATAIAGLGTPTPAAALAVALPVLVAALLLWAHARRRLVGPATEPAP